MKAKTILRKTKLLHDVSPYLASNYSTEATKALTYRSLKYNRGLNIKSITTGIN